MHTSITKAWPLIDCARILSLDFNVPSFTLTPTSNPNHKRSHPQTPQHSNLEHQQIHKMSYVTLAPFVAKRPWLTKALSPIVNWYANASGYRQLGLRYVLRSPFLVLTS